MRAAFFLVEKYEGDDDAIYANPFLVICVIVSVIIFKNVEVLYIITHFYANCICFNILYQQKQY